ncbi:MAG: T9SS type A sorting domain-containing protein [Bacteroidetes bacterium]|nr:T9SS type A sorting domain-containing protein [Bacteroidota bacterium]MBM3424760.1 T9SS type A sorting domain-containing protein [Bacteroidota bacterium]
MKKLILLFSALFTLAMVNSQVIVKGISPAAVAGNYTFSWADPAGGWGTPDFLIPNTWVEDTLMMVEDGTPGTNAQGNPISQEGCNPLTNNLTGKIAVVFRNNCEFGAKALNAQNAGAVGVIIVNRNPGEWINMGPGANGASVTIPVVMLDFIDGMDIVGEMQNGPVVMFMGNKIGLNPNDAGMTASSTLIPKNGGVVSFLAQNGTEFNFDLGTRVYNYGNQAQADITLTATVTDPSGAVVYNNFVSGINLVPGDSLDIEPSQGLNLPAFSLANYPTGRYTLNYNITLSGGNADDDPSDNSASYDFVIQDSLYSFAALDVATGNAAPNAHYRPGTNNATFSICSVLKDPHASRIAAVGAHFSATTNAASGVTLDGEEIALTLYKWEDNFVDLGDPNFGFNTLTQVAGGFYYYPSDLQGALVYGAFDQAVVLEDNVRYLACVQTVNLELYLGFDGNTDYTWNYNWYAQPLSPIESDGTYYAAGFGTDLPNALVLRVIDANNIGLEEASIVNGMAYPNPSNDKVTLNIDGEGLAMLVVTDISGKVAATSTINLMNGSADYSLEGLNNGMYIFNVTLENGKTAQFNVVKK